jgi:hypothetical protein
MLLLLLFCRITTLLDFSAAVALVVVAGFLLAAKFEARA